MPALHESVTLCRKCDHYVAVLETMPCEVCRAPICPGCQKSTSDSDVYVCSERCCARFELDQRQARQELDQAAREGASWLQTRTPGGVQ